MTFVIHLKLAERGKEFRNMNSDILNSLSRLLGELHLATSRVMDADIVEQGCDCGEDEGTSSSASCGCFGRIICPSWRRSSGYVLHQKEEEEEEGTVKEKWWEKRMKKVNVLSELLGGPEWENFLRYRFRFRTSQKMKKLQFQYDPKSYALNFDDGCVDFSARFPGPVESRE